MIHFYHTNLVLYYLSIVLYWTKVDLIPGIYIRCAHIYAMENTSKPITIIRIRIPTNIKFFPQNTLSYVLQR